MAAHAVDATLAVDPVWPVTLVAERPVEVASGRRHAYAR